MIRSITSSSLFHTINRPARWDEWLPFDSPRIAPFRSRTAHSVVSNTFSPTPNVLLPNAPATGPDDIRVLLPELSRSISTVHQMLANTPLPNVRHDRICLIEKKKKTVNFYLCDVLLKESVHDTSNYPWDVNIQARISESIDNDNDFRRHARDLAPLLDRVGRLMSDVSVQLWNQVEPGSYRTSPNPRTLDPLNTLEARLLSLLRER